MYFVLLWLFFRPATCTLHGCGSTWSKELFFDSSENHAWLSKNTSIKRPCEYYSGDFEFKALQPTRLLLLANGPINISINQKLIYRSNEHKMTIYNQLIVISSLKNHIQIEGHVTYFKWYPYQMRFYLYNLPARYNIEPEKDKRCHTSMFAAEPYLFHSLSKHPLRTQQALEADFFYVPLHSMCIKQKQKKYPDLLQNKKLFEQGILHVQTNWPYWRRNYGTDHIFTAVHDFSTCFAWREPENKRMRYDFGTKNATFLVYSGDVSTKCFRQSQDIVIPPFVPDTRRSIDFHFQRDWLAYFQGTVQWITWQNEIVHTYSRGVRQTLYRLYKNSSEIHIHDGALNNVEDYYSRFKRCKFAICPLGMASWSPRTVEALVHGSIPVIVSDSIVLPFSNIIDWRAISIQVSEEDACRPGHLQNILENIDLPRQEAMRRQGQVEVSKLLYNTPQWSSHSVTKTLIVSLEKKLLLKTSILNI